MFFILVVWVERLPFKAIRRTAYSFHLIDLYLYEICIHTNKSIFVCAELIYLLEIGW